MASKEIDLLTPNKSQTLLDNGHISPELHAAITSYHAGKNASSKEDTEGAIVDSVNSAQAAPVEQVAPVAGPAGMSANTEAQMSEAIKNQPAPAAPVAPAPAPTPQQMMDTGFGMQQAAIKAGADAQASGASRVADIYGAQAKAQENQIVEMQKRQADIDNAIKQHATDKKLADEDIAKAAAGRQGFWANKSTGDRFLAGISVALGSIGSGLTGGPNTALQIINNAIDRDTQLQKDKYEMAIKRGQKVSGDYADAMRMYGDQSAASSALLAQKLAYAQSKVQQIAQQTNSAEVKANAAKTIGEIEAKRGEIYQQNAQSMVKKQQEMLPRMVPSIGQYAPTESAAKEINASAADLSTAQHHLDALQEIANTPFKSLNHKMREEAQIHANMLLGLVGKGMLDGANPKITERFQKIMEETVANPTALTSRDSTIKASLHLVGESMRTKHNNMLVANGLKPTTPVGVQERK